MTSCKKKSKFAVILVSYSLEYASRIFHSEKNSKKCRKMGFKKIDPFFSGRLCTEQEGAWTQDFSPDHSSCLAGSRVVRHIRKRFAECLRAIRCNSGRFLRSQLAAQSFSIRKMKK